MRINPLLYSILLSTCINATFKIGVSMDAVLPNAKRLKTDPDSQVNALKNGHESPEQLLSVPHNALPQILAPKMRERSFKDAYKLSRLWKSDDASPLDRQELNPLVLHDANLDNQYALKQWDKMRPGTKKSAVLLKLIENPTVDFSKLTYWDDAFDELIKLGDLDKFKTQFAKVESKIENDMDFGADSVADRKKEEMKHLATNAGQNNQLEIFKYLLNEMKPQTTPWDLQDVVDGVAKSGHKKTLQYLFEGYTLSDGSKLEIDSEIQYAAAQSGNIEILEYVFKTYEKTHETKLRIRVEIQLDVASSGNLDAVKYISHKYEQHYGRKLPIDPQVQVQAAESGNVDVVKYFFDEYEILYGTKMQVDPSTLSAAAESGNLNVLRYLIDKQGASVDYGEIIKGARLSRSSSDPKYMINLLRYLHVDYGVPIPDDISRFKPAEQKYLNYLRNSDLTSFSIF